MRNYVKAVNRGEREFFFFDSGDEAQTRAAFAAARAALPGATLSVWSKCAFVPAHVHAIGDAPPVDDCPCALCTKLRERGPKPD